MLNKSYIENMRAQSGMLFESVLDFVKLPYWRPSMPKSAKPTAKPLDQAAQPTDPVCEPEISTSVDPDPYTAIFDWLWSCKVRKIFTVEVNDDGPEPHTNASIREALRGGKDGKATRNFEVEVWKWKKFDICCETVVTAAPDAREVHLYSHGNTAVLRGWANGTRLAKMNKVRIECPKEMRSFNEFLASNMKKYSSRDWWSTSFPR